MIWYCKRLIGIVCLLIRLFTYKSSHNHILNVFKNFVPNKFITCDDRDSPRINDNIKNQIKWKNSMYKIIREMAKKN